MILEGITLDSIFGQFNKSPIEPTKYRYTIKHTELDKEFYDDHCRATESIRQSIIDGPESHETFPELTQDIFMGLFQHEPILRDKQEIIKQSKFNHRLMDMVLSSEDYTALHDNTVHDYLYSTLGCRVIQDYAIKIIEEMQKEEQQNNPNPDNDENSDQDGDQDSEQPGGPGDSLEKFVQDTIDEKNNKVLQGVNQALEQAKEEVETAKELMQLYGLEEGDPNRRVPLSQRIEALKRLRNSRKLREFAETIGRLREIATEESKHKQKEGVSIESIATGNSLPLVLSSEKVRLTNPIAKKDFQRRYLDRQLLQFEVEGAETLAKGPIIACVDASGSMRAHNNEKDKWARGLAMSLLETAQIQRRNFACIIFDSVVHKIIKIPYNRVDTNDILDMVEIAPGGGTNFEEPLKAALEIMEDNRFHNGDITLISDGEADISELFLKKFLAQKKEQEFKVRTILIGSHSPVVYKISDNVILIADLLEGEKTAREVLREIQ